MITNDKPVYPEIKIIKIKDKIKFATYLRKEFDGKYYLLLHINDYVIQDNVDDNYYLQEFIKQVYYTLIMYDKLKDLDKLDNSQESEKTRLLSKFIKP